MSMPSCMGSPDLEGFDEADELGLEGVVDFVVDDEAFCRDAGLAVVEDAGLDGGADGFVEVGGRHDDEGVGAAELEHGTLDEPAGLGGDGAAGGLGTGDGDGGDTLVGDDGLDLLGFDEQRLKGASREAGAADERLNGHGGLGDV